MCEGRHLAKHWQYGLLKGTKQIEAIKTGLDKEPEVLEHYFDQFNVNVSPCGFVVHPDAPYLDASPIV